MLISEKRKNKRKTVLERRTASAKMGFPRIISKNNKIYTKLGEFCLSCDGTNFWIICHTCQEELQTQDQFWKHIQDEHNFLHGLNKENNRVFGGTFTEPVADATMMPLSLYRKVNDNDPRVGSIADSEEDSQDQQEPKDYTDIGEIEANDVKIDIKVEPPSNSSHVQSMATTAAPQTFYQLSQHIPAAMNSAYSTVVHSLPTLTMPTLAPIAPQAAMVTTSLLPHELDQQQQKQQHASLIKDDDNTKDGKMIASSAISSDDGERWYICDFETCGLKFKYQSRLELHRSVHSKERRFACELCGASFKQSCNLSTHRKKKHFLKGLKSVASHIHLTGGVVVPPSQTPPQQQIRF